MTKHAELRHLCKRQHECIGNPSYSNRHRSDRRAPSSDLVPKPIYLQPTYGACTYNNFVTASKISVTLNPGVYCGGLKLGAGDNATFNPGLYVINGGQFITQGGSTVQGTGVSFYLTGNQAGVSFTGGDTFHLSAMTTGSLAGFLFFLDRNAVPNKVSVVGGGGNVFYEGILYFPTQPLNFTGGSTSTGPSNYGVYIADTILYGGGGTLIIKYDPTKTSVPILPGVYAPGGGTPYLVN